MTKQTRRKFTAEFKARVALEAAKDQLTLAELSNKYELSGVLISRWKKEFLSNLSATFEGKSSEEEQTEQVNIEKLYAQIGQLKVENDFLKKSCKKLGI
jgi:transposase-like protein